MKNASLYYKEGTSDKEYHIQLEESNGGYVVNFQYGRVGNALQSGTKTATPVSLAEAEKIYDKLYKEKTGKGYSEGEKKNDYSQVNTSKSKEVIILPQLLNAIEDAEQYINDDDYLAQEKMDGERRMVIFGEDKTIGVNKKGTEVPLPNTIMIMDVATLDGEIIGDTLHVFDILSYNGEDIKHLSCIERVRHLHMITVDKGIKILETAFTRTAKLAMFNRLKSENREGIVFKRKDSKYTHGRPASGGNALKYKFYKTATFIVEGSTKGKRSVGLELVSGKERVFMGKVTIPPNFDVPNTGDLVEVRYLYAYKDGAIFQPVYLGKRTDSDLTDATISQIVYKGNTGGVKTKIYGASDDLIEIEGAIIDEHDGYDFSGTVVASDGTTAKLKYDKDGQWKFALVKAGDKFVRIIDAVGDEKKHTEADAVECSSYSDVLVLEDGIEWVKIGRKTYKK